MAQNKLDVERAGQDKPFFCGPACAWMYVKYAWKSKGVISPMPAQADLWAFITANSPSTQPAGIVPPPDPSYQKQHCDNCGISQQTGKTIWSCWSTSPEGLATTIKSHAPNLYGVEVKYPNIKGNGIDLMIAALDGTPKLPAIFTKTSVNHWCLLIGYLRDDTTLPDLPLVSLGSYNLNALYVLDPETAGSSGNPFLFVKASEFSSQYGSITCGTHSGEYPTLVPDHAWSFRVKPWWIWVVAVLSLGVLIGLYLWARS